MKDIVRVESGSDLGVANSVIPRAANILSVQLGELEYEPEFGVDKKYFLQNGFVFQNQSFKTYLIQRLSAFQINVAEVLETLQTLFLQYTFFIKQEFDPANQFSEQEILDNVLTDADGSPLLDANGEPLLNG